MELDEISRRVLAECAYDDVHLGSIIWRLHGTGYNPDDPALRPLRPQALDVVRRLLESGLIYAENPVGAYLGADFKEISGSVSEVMDFINREWDALGRTPQFGEVCWFRATPKGKQLAKELGLLT